MKLPCLFGAGLVPTSVPFPATAHARRSPSLVIETASAFEGLAGRVVGLRLCPGSGAGLYPSVEHWLPTSALTQRTQLPLPSAAPVLRVRGAQPLGLPRRPSQPSGSHLVTQHPVPGTSGARLVSSILAAVRSGWCWHTLHPAAIPSCRLRGVNHQQLQQQQYPLLGWGWGRHCGD